MSKSEISNIPSSSLASRNDSAWAISKKCRTTSGPSSPASKVSKYPRMDVKGVRNSCPTVEKKSYRSRSRAPRSNALSTVPHRFGSPATDCTIVHPLSTRKPVARASAAESRWTALRQSVGEGTALRSRARSRSAARNISLRSSCASKSARRKRLAAPPRNASAARRSNRRAAPRPRFHAVRSKSGKRMAKIGTSRVARRSLAASVRTANNSNGASLRRREFVPKTVNGLQNLRKGNALFDLDSQAPDVHVDRPLVTVEVEAPHALEQGRAGQRDAGVTGQLEQQRKLARLQTGVDAVDANFSRRFI